VTPAGFLFLTHADTDLLALSKAVERLPPEFPPVRAANLGYLKTDQDVDAFLDQALPAAEVVILRLLGGRASFAHGLERLRRDAAERGTWLLCLYGESGLDLREALRTGCSDAEIARQIAVAWAARADRGAEVRAGASDRGALYQLESLRADPHREMHTRGG